MGDRTWVDLTIPKKCKERAMEVFAKNDESPEVVGSDEHTITFCFYEINGGILDSEYELNNLLIPFDASNGSGYEYGPYERYSRTTEDGEICSKEWSESSYKTVCVEDTLNAYNEGRIEEFLYENKKYYEVQSLSEHVQELGDKLSPSGFISV